MTASAMVADVALSPESYLDRPPSGFSALCRLSPRISLTRDLTAARASGKADPPAQEISEGELSGGDYTDFEFRLHDPVDMLHADELFADGKLVPLQLTAAKTAVSASEIQSLEHPKALRKTEESGSYPYVFSPRAPSCIRTWRELLGLKRAESPKPDEEKVRVFAKCKDPNPEGRPRKHFFYRNPRPSLLEPSQSISLLRESDSESLSISSRLSLSSSSSSGPDYEDVPRHSLDTDKPGHYVPMLRLVRPVPAMDDHGRGRIRRAAASEMAPTTPTMTVAADSPRMNPSGKVIFHGLERSSSSPGSFTGGPRPRVRGVERSFSANVVRVTPVLNVPVCSLRGSAKAGPVFGLGQLFTPQKKEKASCRRRLEPPAEARRASAIRAQIRGIRKTHRSSGSSSKA